jgi:hypothetical protein
MSWHTRKDLLDECRDHGLIRITHTVDRECDVCHSAIVDNTWRRSEDIDVCNRCQPSPEMANLNFTVVKRGISRFDASGFGSILDWIPIAQDRDKYDGYGMVLVCMNITSPNYLHIAVSHGDDHGRGGYIDMGLEWKEFVKKANNIIAHGHPSMREDFECDVCHTDIEDEKWQQAVNGWNSKSPDPLGWKTVDVCGKCVSSEEMKELKTKHAFREYPPGDPKRIASRIVRTLMLTKGDKCYYG